MAEDEVVELMMGKHRETEFQAAVPPRDFAQTAPTYPATDYSFTLQVVMEMQKTLGSLNTKIDSLDRNLAGVTKEVSRHGKWIFAATVLVAVFTGIVGYIASIAWDVAKLKMGLAP